MTKLCRYEIPQTVKMCGGYTAELTPAEENEWAEHVRVSPQWMARMEADVALSKAIYANADTDRLLVEQMEATDALYVLAKAWHAALLAKDAAEKEPSHA